MGETAPSPGWSFEATGTEEGVEHCSFTSLEVIEPSPTKPYAWPMRPEIPSIDSVHDIGSVGALCT